MKYYKYVFEPINIFFIFDGSNNKTLQNIFSIKEVDSKEHEKCDEKYSIFIKNCDSLTYKVDLQYNGLSVMKKKIQDKTIIVFLCELLDYLINLNSNLISFHSSGFLYGKNLVLFINKSGSGKTTALLSCLYKIKQSKYFADDRVVVNSRGEISGITNALKVKTGTIKLLDMHNEDLIGPFKKKDLNQEKINFWFNFPKNIPVSKPISFNDCNIKIILIKYEFGEKLKIIKYKGIEKINALLNNCYNIKQKTKDALIIIKLLALNSDMYQVNYSNPADLISFIMTFNEKDS